MRLKSKNEQIKIVLENTNFNLINKTMKNLNWTWSDSETGERRVPNIKELKMIAIDCIVKALKSEDGYAQIGNFECEVNKGAIELKFVLTRANPLSKLLS